MYGPLRRTYSFRLPGLVRGRLRSAMSRAIKASFGVRFAGTDKLVHLIEAGVVALCWAREGMSAWTGPGRSAKASPIGIKPSCLDCMAYSPMCLRQGHPRHPAHYGFTMVLAATTPPPPNRSAARGQG